MKITVVFFYLCLIKCFSSAGKSFERERNVFLLFFRFSPLSVASGAFFSHQYSQNARLSSLSLRSRIDQPHSAISFRRKPRDNRESARERENSLSIALTCVLLLPGGDFPEKGIGETSFCIQCARAGTGERRIGSFKACVETTQDLNEFVALIIAAQ